MSDNLQHGLNDSAMPGGDAAFDCHIDSLSGRDWDRIVGGFDDGVIDQTWSFAAASWGGDRLSNALLRYDGEIVAACLLVQFRPALLHGGIAHARFGPMWRRGGTADTTHLREMLQALRREYVEQRGMFLRIMPPAYPAADNAHANELLAQGFVQDVVPDSERFLVNVSIAEESLRSGLKSKWRYHLKKASQEALTIECGHDENSIDGFLSLYAAMRSRKTFSDARALRHLHETVNGLPDEHKPVIWLCRHEGAPVAGAVVSHIGDSALYLFGASNDRGRELRAGYLLHFAIAGRMRDAGCKWYDLGGACDNSGLRQFKSGFVGKHGVTALLPGYFDLAPGALSSIAAKSIFRLKDFLGAAQERLARTRTKTRKR